MKKYLYIGIVLLALGLAACFWTYRVYADSAGPNGPSSETQSGIGDSWSTLSSLNACDTAYATVTLTNVGSPSNLVAATGYGFSIPAGATINGISLSVIRKAGSSSNVVDVTVQLLKNNVAVGTNKASGTAWPTVAAAATYGGVADLWGTTWTASDINNANFGLNFKADKLLSGSVLASVDCAQITITYTVATVTQSATAMMMANDF